jgi:hypothetical protein
MVPVVSPFPKNGGFIPAEALSTYAITGERDLGWDGLAFKMCS